MTWLADLWGCLQTLPSMKDRLMSVMGRSSSISSAQDPTQKLQVSHHVARFHRTDLHLSRLYCSQCSDFQQAYLPWQGSLLSCFCGVATNCY